MPSLRHGAEAAASDMSYVKDSCSGSQQDDVNHCFMVLGLFECPAQFPGDSSVVTGTACVTQTRSISELTLCTRSSEVVATALRPVHDVHRIGTDSGFHSEGGTKRYQAALESSIGDCSEKNSGLTRRRCVRALMA